MFRKLFRPKSTPRQRTVTRTYAFEYEEHADGFKVAAERAGYRVTRLDRQDVEAVDVLLDLLPLSAEIAEGDDDLDALAMQFLGHCIGREMIDTPRGANR